MERADLMNNDIIYQKAVELFEQEEFEEAVELFIQLYESDYEKDIIIQNLYDCFVVPNEKEFQRNFEKNIEALHVYSNEKLLLDFIPISDTKYYIFHKEKLVFLGSIDISDSRPEEQEAEIHSVLIADTWDLREMIPFIRVKAWNSVYILLNEYKGEFLSFLKLPDIEEKYLHNAVIFQNDEIMKQYFLEFPQFYLPKEIVSKNERDYDGIINKLHQKRLEDMQCDRDNIFLSICIPSYGRGSVLLENVKNLLQVKYDSEIEIVVSNNGSTEDIEGYETVKKLNDSRITYFAFGENQGYAANVCKTLELSKGQFIVFCSDEDFMKTESLHNYMNFLLNHIEAGIFQAIGGIGPNFIEPVYQKFEKGIESFVRAINENYLTGLTLNQYWVKKNHVLERIAAIEETRFVYAYMQCVLACLTVEDTFACMSPIILWESVVEGETVEEKGKEIVSYMHYEDRIEQQNSAIWFIENVMRVNLDEWWTLMMERIGKTYFLCELAYSKKTEAYRKLIDWRELCKSLHKNNIKLLEENKKRLSEYGLKELRRFMEEQFFKYISQNPIQFVQSEK